MIETVEQLKKERPDLVESFENMTKEQLLDHILFRTPQILVVGECQEHRQTLNKHYIITVYDKSIILKRLL